MPKKPLSVTLEEDNLLWLKGRVAASGRRSLSEALDEIVTAARTGGHGASASRSVVGTVDIADVDPGLDGADDYLRTMFEASLTRPVLVREDSVASGAPAAAPHRPRARSARRPARRG